MGRHKITSTIEIITEEGNMKSRKRHHYKSKRSSDESKGKSEESSETITDSSSSEKDLPKKSHRYKSTAKASKHGFFHGVNSDNAGVKQEVHVAVNIDQGEDTIDKIAGCFGRCFGKGAKAASGGA